MSHFLLARFSHLSGVFQFVVETFEGLLLYCSVALLILVNIAFILVGLPEGLHPEVHFLGMGLQSFFTFLLLVGEDLYAPE